MLHKVAELEVILVVVPNENASVTRSQASRNSVMLIKVPVSNMMERLSGGSRSISIRRDHLTASTFGINLRIMMYGLRNTGAAGIKGINIWRNLRRHPTKVLSTN